MTLTLDLTAALLATSPSRTRTTDSAARELATRTKANRKRAVLADAARAAERFWDYTLCDSHDDAFPCDACQHGRIAMMRAVHWPRTRAVRDALSQSDALVTRHRDTHDDYTMTAYELDGAIIRGIRLATLLARMYAASATYGAFPVSRGDMRTDRRTRFIGSAAARHFTFAGGRDWGSAEFEPADIVNGAFIRAIEAGNVVDGVPTFGSMFRWIQTERAHLTRVANAEFAARKRASLGWDDGAIEEWPDATDPRAMRLIGTRNYPTLAQHRESLALAHRDAEMATMDDYVTRSAREDELSAARQDEYHVIVANALMGGATLADISAAIGQRVETIVKDVRESREKSLRNIDTRIDHSERSIDMHNAAERERAEALADERHAERLRAIEATRATVHYAIGRRA